MVLCIIGVILQIEVFNDFNKNLLDLINEFGKIVGYEIKNKSKNYCFMLILIFLKNKESNFVYFLKKYLK